VVYSCICQNDAIICDGYNAYDFNQIFSDMSRHLNDSEKKFQTFILNNTEITEIPENSFEDIEFTKIVIKDATLAQIHSRAFNVNFTANTIKEVEQIGSSKL
jgi:N-acetylneuraminic acid mutarotase